jgi:ribosomal protein S18 acetylase RimI-like enzyme
MEFDDVTLRACGVEDAAALALVGAATFLEAFAGTLDGKAIVAHCAKVHAVAAYEKYLGQPRCQAWLAETRAGAAPVGYAMLTEPDLPLADLGLEDIELKRIYLFSRFHGKGAGQMLLDVTVEAARAAGNKRLLLGVYRGNLRGLGFYRKNGFVEVGVRTFSVGGQTYDDLVLGRPL